MSGALLSPWFLVPLCVRRAVCVVVDLAVTTALLFALYTLPFVPSEAHPDAIELPAIARGITTLFAIRALLRTMPSLLDAVELTGFRALVAARLLRARQRGFLTVIGLLSLPRVSLPSCTRAPPPPVWAGFRPRPLGLGALVVAAGALGPLGAHGDQPVDQRQLVGGFDKALLVLQPVTRGHFNDLDAVDHGVDSI